MDWFLLRNFCITSTVAKIALNAEAVYSDEESIWLNEMLSMRCHDPTPITTNVEYLSMPVEELLKLSKQELSDICKSNGHTISGNKSDLVGQIQHWKQD
jgi:hypothetical protein